MEKRELKMKATIMHSPAGYSRQYNRIYNEENSWKNL